VRRAVLAIVGTAAGTTLLVGLKAYGAESPATQNAAQTDQTNQTAAAPPASKAAPPAAGAPAGGAAAPPASKAAGSRDGSFTGKTVQTPYGPVTVTITMKGGKITDVAAVLPSTGESKAIAGRAGPQLRQQTLARQSAKVDTVTGATYTSEGYRQSLQSAIDQAKR
jgi:uncharacterized protein with FMN-binding domain